MTSYRDQTDQLSGETTELQYDDVPETEKEPRVMETLREKLLREREEDRRRVDRMIAIAAETPIVLRPGLSKSDAYDFFIAHTGDPDEGSVPEMVQELRRRGAKVWYEDCILREGDNLRQRMDEGLENSLFGMVVLSLPLFVGGWSREELENLVSPETRDRDKRIFPLWHCVSKDEVLRYSPRVADWVTLGTHAYLPEEIADKMLQAKGIAPRKGGRRYFVRQRILSFQRRREEYNRRVDRMIELAAETPIVLRPGLSKSDAYDFFIAYTEDTDDGFVAELVEGLRKRGAKVRCEDCILREGDNLRRRMDEGLENSLFGAVVLSPPFFARGWPREELENLLSPETRDSDKRIFPLLHCVSKEEVLQHGLRLPDRESLKSREYLPEEVVEKLLRAKELCLAKAGGASS